MSLLDQVGVEDLADALLGAWRCRNRVFFCGNGGSAGNAIHLVNDLIFGIGRDVLPGIQCEALTANVSTLTCLANDTDYSKIFSLQLDTLAKRDDILIALSGSGNSQNIVNAIEKANEIGMKTFAILGFTGGKCLDIAQHSIHFPISDMQVAEDMQIIVGHIVAQWLMKEIK